MFGMPTNVALATVTSMAHRDISNARVLVIATTQAMLVIITDVLL